jgi:hypothetical protein
VESESSLSRTKEIHMHYVLTVTPVESNGYELASTTYVLSQADMENPDFGELLPPLILDWADVAREFDELGRRIDSMSDAERQQLGLVRATSQMIRVDGEVSE